MKKSVQIALLGFSLVSVSTLATENLELEPCINGEVSASGAFINQDAEDHYHKSLQQSEVPELEPCINGEVSASGLFPNQVAEDHHRTLLERNNAGFRMTSIGGGTGY